MSTKTRTFSKMLAAVALSAILLTGCTINPATGKRELILIPEYQEIAMGREAAPTFEEEFGGKVPSQQLQDYVQMVGRSVADLSDRPMPYEFTLVSSDVANAFALPGGQIFITAGLMRQMQNERELVAVLAHEVGHVNALHNVKGLQRQMGAGLLAEVAAVLAGEEKGKTAKAAAEIVTGMANLKYSRNDEYQADQLGIKYMTKAGYNPWGMAEMLTLLLELSESEPGTLGEMFQTHPLTSKRIEATEEGIRENPDYSRHSAAAADHNVERFGHMRSLLLETLGQSQ